MKNKRTIPQALFAIALACSLASARADTFVYDDAGRLLSASQTNGLSHGYSYDPESNLVSANHSGTDTTDTGGAGNGIPDWWEYYYFGVRGVDPLASPASDGVVNLIKYVLGLNPLVSASGSSISVTFQTYTDGLVYPYVTYVRMKDAASLVQVEQSTDLAAWQTGNLYLVQMGNAQDLGNGTELVTLRSLTPLPNALKLFFRLKVVGN